MSTESEFDELAAHRDSDQVLRGLSNAEVAASRAEHGSNALTPPSRESWWKLYLEKFQDPVIQILLLAAAIAIAAGAADGHYIEGIGIVCAILLSTFLAFINEYQAGKQFDLLNQASDDVPIKVLRGGKYASVPRRELVVGDIVLLDAGEEVPADGNVLESVSFLVDEAHLTGESEPVEKYSLNEAQTSTHEAAPDEGNAYPPSVLLRGTLVSAGRGTMRVTSVGDRTEVGQTARAAMESDANEKTPLSRQLELLSKRIGVIGFAVSFAQMTLLCARGAISGDLQLNSAQWTCVALIFTALQIALVRVWLSVVFDGLDWIGIKRPRPAWLTKGGITNWLLFVGAALVIFAVVAGACVSAGFFPRDFTDWIPHDAAKRILSYFMVAVTLVVVSVPEGLAMSVTLSLAYSMKKMAAAQNLVRKMHACETIGAASVICSDKTGTLTLGEMRVHRVRVPALGEAAGKSPKANSIFPFVAEAFAANSAANLSREAGKPPAVLGNPTEGSLLLWLDAQGDDYLQRRRDFQVVRQWPFATERKFMATLGRSATGADTTLHAKGAPEIILARCVSLRDSAGEHVMSAEERSAIEASLRASQSQAMRTLGFAYLKISQSVNGDEIKLEQFAGKMVWLGFVEIADPVRPEVPAAVQECVRAGIQIKIVTGDNHRTAGEIGRQIGLLGDHDAPGARLTGPEFEKLSDAQLAACVNDLKVLSRARPMDKLRLVRALQALGHVVAVTGDGSNDAPALNHADVGLSMGKSGTAVAREASDIVLLDDSFQSIARAVMWGRSLYENIQRFIVFQLTVNVAALGIALLGPFAGVQMPLTVVQMLWVNLIMDTFAALALASEPPRESVMDRPPRKPGDFIVSMSMARSILVTGALFLAAFLGLLIYFSEHFAAAGSAPDRDRALTLFFSFFVLLQFWNLFNARRIGSSESSLSGLAQNKMLLLIAGTILVVQILIVQFGGQVFRTVPLPAQDWLLLIASTSTVLWTGEFLRWIARLRK